VGIIAVVLGACLGTVGMAWLLRPAQANNYGPDLERAVTGACLRSAPNVDHPEAACRCAYRRLAATMPFERFRQLDGELRNNTTPAPEVVAAVKDCASAAS
jgi:hypothetical protein